MIAVKAEISILVFDRNFTALKIFKLSAAPPTHRASYGTSTTDILSISKDLLFIICYHFQQRLFLLNLKNGTVRACSRNFIPHHSCVAMIEEAPQKVFTCLASPLEHRSEVSYWCALPLTQFIIDPETEELTVTKVTKDFLVNRLFRLENSNHFLADQKHEMVMLLIKRNHVEIIRVISKSVNPLRPKPCHFIMLKDESMVSINWDEKFCISMHLYRQEKSKNSTDFIEPQAITF